MPVILTGGRALIDPYMILNRLGVQGKVFADLRAGGHGHFVVAAARGGAERGSEARAGRVIAIEPYRMSAEALRGRLADFGHHNDVELLHADVESPRGVPLKDGEIEIALLANALHAMTKPLRAIVELRRILKSGGTLAVIGPKEQSPFFALAKTRGISEDTARYLFEEHGFVCERRFDAGPHHICLVFRNA